MEVVSQQYRNASVDELTTHPENPRQGDVGAIHTSIETNGFYGAIIVQKSTQHVLAGNHRLLALRQAGATEVPILEIDVDDATALRILLADNRTNDVASYDDNALLDVLRAITNAEGGVENLVGTGYDGDDLDALIRLSLAGAAPLDPNAEWQGMPDFSSENIDSIFSCTVHFRTPEDADAFFAGIDRPKRKTFWWPTDDGHVGSDRRVAYISKAAE